MLNKTAQELREYVETAKGGNRLDSATFDDVIQLWRLIDPVGYMRLYGAKPTPRNYFDYQYEHRKVLAEALGRELMKNEIVHHKDENKLNNVPENLELVLDHIEHMKQHPEWRVRKTKPIQSGLRPAKYQAKL